MLKKLFIPHEGNNYQPHALHPHRLLFHGFSAIIIKAFIIIAVLALPTSAWLTPDVMTKESQEIITLTNNLRIEHDLPVLEENLLLNQAAYNKVEDMIINQYFAHMSPDNKNMLYWLKTVGYSYIIAGENLAMGFSSAQNVVTAWTKSKTHYANMVEPNFKQIGVAMISGNFKDRNTTLAAQYFGTPKIDINLNLQADTLQQSDRTIAPIRKVHPNLVARQSIKGIKVNYNIVSNDTEAPIVDLTKTKIWITEAGLRKDRIVQVEAYLSPDTIFSQVSFDRFTIDLNQDPTDLIKWTGSLIIPRDEIEQIFNPVVLAVLTAQDAAGNTVNTDINWENYEQIQPSLVQQYLFLKNSPNKNISMLFKISKIYLLIILIICVVALSLNILIEIRNQHPHLIVSALSLIVLLVFLLIL